MEVRHPGPCSYDELGKLIKEARADQADRGTLHGTEPTTYLKLPGTTLETAARIRRQRLPAGRGLPRIDAKADCRAITINACMGTIMPLAGDLGLPDAQPAERRRLPGVLRVGFRGRSRPGVLLANISGLPVFLNDPTYPHDGIITLAHCTARARWTARTLEPARILTHFESDYGAARRSRCARARSPRTSSRTSSSNAGSACWARSSTHPFLPICRSQIDIQFKCDSLRLAERMPGFHWMTGYGDYTRELGYALKRLPIKWEFLGSGPGTAGPESPGRPPHCPLPPP